MLSCMFLFLLLTIKVFVSNMVTTAFSKGKVEDIESCPCPAACGLTISGKDHRPVCITCIGVRHAEALPAGPESCAMPTRILERHLQVSAASKSDPCLSNTDVKPTDKPAKVTAYWKGSFPCCSVSSLTQGPSMETVRITVAKISKAFWTNGFRAILERLAALQCRLVT